MKFNKIFSMVAVLALTSLAFAGPHDFDTFTANNGTTNNLGAADFWARPDGPNADAENYVRVTNGTFAGGNYGINSNTFNFTTPGTNTESCDSAGSTATNDGFYCAGQDLVYSTSALTTAFAVVVGQYHDTWEGQTGTESIASFGSGASTFFWTADTSLPDSASTWGASHFYELDINIDIASSGDVGDNGVHGIWRLGFAVSDANSGSTATLSLGNGGLQDSNGSFALVSSTPSGAEEGAPAVVLNFVDSEFDPTQSSVPEPTTMLLLGSGLLAVARRFRS